MNSPILKHNLRNLLETRNLSVTEAACLAGVSKQYLSQYLTDISGTKRDHLLDELCLILEISPASLLSEEPFPAKPGAIPPPSTPSPAPSIPVTKLLPRLQELYALEQYQPLTELYLAASEQSLAGLSVREQVETQFLAGKALVHCHQSALGTELLASSLKLFQQRQSLQPAVYLPRIMDCFRYLALAAYLQGDKERSLFFHQKLVAKAIDLGTDLVDGELMNKLRPALINAITLAKQRGNAALAAKFRSQGSQFFRAHSDRQGIEWLARELALSKARVAHLFPDFIDSDSDFPLSRTPKKLSSILTRAHQGLTWLDRELALNGSENAAGSTDDRVSGEMLWRTNAYLAISSQDYSMLQGIIESLPSKHPRIRLFAHYLQALMSVSTDGPTKKWADLCKLQSTFYSGDVLHSDYYMIAHIKAELAHIQGHRQSALNNMLDALACTRIAGKQEERLRLLDRLQKMEIYTAENSSFILEQKITNARAWLNSYWENDNATRFD